MKPLKAAWQRLVSFVKRLKEDEDECTSEYLHMKDFR